MAVNSESQINLKTLQRVDCNIIEILDNACQVAIYKYDRKLEKWEGTDIEGTLFLFRRSCEPSHGLIIVNRMSTTNFVESITSNMQFQLQQPYLLYKNYSGEIIGSWFYEHKDLRRIFKKIQTIMLKQVSSPKRQRCASESETLPQNEDSQDIMTLLSEAHEEYMKKSSGKIESPQNNVKDVNNLSTYLEKKSLEKSITSFEKKQENIGVRFSLDYPVSPRRRFLSTGSFDPDRANYFSRMLSAVKLKTISSSDDKKNNLMKESSCIYNDKDNLQQKLSPTKIFNQEKSSSLDSANMEGTNETDDMPYSLNTLNDKNWRSVIRGDCDKQLATIKDALRSHIEENPKVMLKIHEAYVSSLKSLFTKNSC